MSGNRYKCLCFVVHSKYLLLFYFRVIEVFTWLLEVANDTKEHWDGGRIVWSVSYVHDGPKIKDIPIENTNGTPEETRRKLVAKLEIQKDDIQAVLPISKVMRSFSALLMFFYMFKITIQILHQDLILKRVLMRILNRQLSKC